MLQQLFKVDDAHEFKPILAEIEDAPASPLARMVLWLILITIVFFALWLYFGQVDVVVTTRGKVVPVGHVKDLAPLDTGVVSKILVNEGDRVKKGQVLMEIDPSSTEPEVESTATNLHYARLEMARLKATLTGGSFAGGGGEAATTQSQLHQASVAELEKQIRAKEAELSKVDEEMKAAEVEAKQNGSLLKTARSKEERLAPVVDIIARDEFDQVQKDIVTYSNGMEQSSHKLEELAHRRSQILEEIEYAKENFRSTHLRELTDKQKAATDLSAKLKEFTFRNAKQRVVSPVNGYVDKLLVHTVGGVVRQAEPVVRVVPIGAPLLVQAAVANKDVGFVEPGMLVSIKVDTFDFQKYGMFEGKVKQISQDSYEERPGGPVLPGPGGTSGQAAQSAAAVYDVYIRPVTKTIRVEGNDEPLASGMSVTAEIKTGKRRIIEFFIYPLVKYWGEGISVR